MRICFKASFVHFQMKFPHIVLVSLLLTFLLVILLAFCMHHILYCSCFRGDDGGLSVAFKEECYPFFFYGKKKEREFSMLKLQRFYHSSLSFPPWAGKLTDVLTKILSPVCLPLKIMSQNEIKHRKTKNKHFFYCLFHNRNTHKDYRFIDILIDLMMSWLCSSSTL